NRAAQRRMAGAAPGKPAGFGAQAVQRWQAARAALGRLALGAPAPLQRTPARGIAPLPIQRLVSKDAWIAFSAGDIKDNTTSKKKSKLKNKQQVDPEKEAFKAIADLVGQYEATKDSPKNETTRAEQFKILYAIEHKIYALFEAAPDRG